MLGDQELVTRWTEIISHDIHQENVMTNVTTKVAIVGCPLSRETRPGPLTIKVMEAIADKVSKVMEPIVDEASRVMEVAVGEVFRVMRVAVVETSRAEAKTSEVAVMAVVKVSLVAPGTMAAALEETQMMAAAETVVTVVMEVKTASEGTTIELLTRRTKMMALIIETRSTMRMSMRRNWTMTSLLT